MLKYFISKLVRYVHFLGVKRKRARPFRVKPDESVRTHSVESLIARIRVLVSPYSAVMDYQASDPPPPTFADRVASTL